MGARRAVCVNVLRYGWNHVASLHKPVAELAASAGAESASVSDVLNGYRSWL